MEAPAMLRFAAHGGSSTKSMIANIGESLIPIVAKGGITMFDVVYLMCMIALVEK